MTDSQFINNMRKSLGNWNTLPASEQAAHIRLNASRHFQNGLIDRAVFDAANAYAEAILTQEEKTMADGIQRVHAAQARLVEDSHFNLEVARQHLTEETHPSVGMLKIGWRNGLRTDDEICDLIVIHLQPFLAFAPTARVTDGDVEAASKVLAIYGDVERAVEACMAYETDALPLCETEDDAPFDETDRKYFRSCLEAASNARFSVPA